MLTIKNQVRDRAVCGLVFLIVLLFLLPGCAPSGPRAFNRGKQLFDHRQYGEALKEFQKAALALSTNAVAWHYLGLAAHYAGQPAEAERAYARALTLNRDLAEARYNLGCLLLEQNRSEEAKAQLVTYILRRGSTLDSCLKLGSAQLRTRDPVGAEKAFGEALRLSPTNAEALNGFGLARMQRGRTTDAVQQFTTAIRHDPQYAPALLNLAIVRQQYLKDLPGALAAYNGYLRAQPKAGNAEAVSTIVTRLDRTLAPPVRPAAPNLASTENSAPVRLQPQPPAETTAPAQNQSVTTVRKTVTPPVQRPASAGPGDTSPPVARAQPSRPAPAPQEQAPPPAVRETTSTTQPTSPPPSRVETVKLPAEPPVKPAEDVTSPSPEPAPKATTQYASSRGGPVIAEDPPDREKKGFLQSINPLNLLQGDKKEVQPAPAPAPAVARQTTSAPSPTANSAVTLLSGPRYRYRNPAKPIPGNRAEAQRALARGIQAQTARRFQEAVQAYRQAIQMDPSFFEAHYNLGLAQDSLGNAPAALAAYEEALAIEPRSPDARINFAVTLRDANYLADAVNEFNHVIRMYPNEERAHLALGNIYSQQLGQSSKARPHYVKVLELEPRHPQANAIRHWLSVNPG